MKVYTYISPNNGNMSKEAKLLLDELKLKNNEANEILYELNSKKDEINTFIIEANERVEAALSEISEELNITQSDIDNILGMVGDL